MERHGPTGREIISSSVGTTGSAYGQRSRRQQQQQQCQRLQAPSDRGAFTGAEGANSRGRDDGTEGASPGSGKAPGCSFPHRTGQQPRRPSPSFPSPTHLKGCRRQTRAPPGSSHPKGRVRHKIGTEWTPQQGDEGPLGDRGLCSGAVQRTMGLQGGCCRVPHLDVRDAFRPVRELHADLALRHVDGDRAIAGTERKSAPGGFLETSSLAPGGVGGSQLASHHQEKHRAVTTGNAGACWPRGIQGA